MVREGGRQWSHVGPTSHGSAVFRRVAVGLQKLFATEAAQRIVDELNRQKPVYNQKVAEAIEKLLGTAK